MTPRSSTITRLVLKSVALTTLLVRAVSAAPAQGEPARHAIAIDPARIEEAVKAEMTAQRIPGVSIAVVKAGEIAYAQGFGYANVEHNVPVRPETVFQSGSVGKQFTATAVMMLVEQGKIGLDDSIAKYFPQAPEPWKAITVRRLLTHTSGMTDYPSGFDFRRDYTEDELIKRGMLVPLAFAPGEKWSYSNLGFVTLGVLIHTVTGEFYGDFLQERIFEPLGMTTARIIDEADIVPNRAAGYRLVKGELKNQEWVSPTLNTTADGALYLTTLDMAKWDAALYTNKLLTKASLDQMWTPVRLNDGTTYPYGFGWSLSDVRGHRVIEHGGSWQGFKAYIARYVDDTLTIVAFDNLAGSRLDRVVHRIAAACDPDLAAPEPKPIEVRTPPVAAKVATVVDYNGQKRVDDYFWLRDRNDPRVVPYLQAENAYAESVMKPTEELRDTLYGEMVGRLEPDEASVPVEDNGFFYNTRYERGKDYPVYCRRKGSPTAPEEVMLDVNTVATGLKLCKVAGLAVSPDNRLLAFGVDARGDRLYTVRVKDLITARLLADEVPGTAADIAWAADSRTFFYTVREAASLRTYQVKRHTLGDPVTADALIFQEDDVTFEIGLRISKSRQMVLIETASETSSECRYLEASNPRGRFRVFQARTSGLRYWVEHAGGTFWVRTNLDAPNFRLVRAAPERTAKASWEPVVAYRPDVLLEEFDVFDGFCVLAERVKGLPRLRIIGLVGHSDRIVAFEDEAYATGLAETPEFASRAFRIHYSSLAAPESIFEVDLRTGGKKLLKQAKVGGGYDPANYVVRRLEAPASDGVMVPISLVFRKGLKLDGGNPLLLYGYGAYGSIRNPDFASERVSLLDRGFVFAIAHIRGGQDLGLAWYEDGKLLRKKNTYSDFIACAEYLIAQKYTSPAKLFANGASAGGMLMAVVANWRPDLFRGILAEVPWTDVVADSLDPKVPLVTIEYQEWGDPRRKDDFDYLLSYSPYENVKPQAYPALLVTGGLNDSQVAYWNPARWVAKLRATKTDANQLLLVTNMASGHSGASGRLERYHLTALKYAFMLQLVGTAE
jgi:oligopeptidase B